MNRYFVLPALILAALTQACGQSRPTAVLDAFPPVIRNAADYNPLDPFEARVVLDKGTEYAFSGAYHDFKKKGTYICKQCNLPLFRSADKFDSGTGWPSFDDIIADNVAEVPDADGQRTEIICANCKGHLGHVFRGEGFTRKMTRHCANSASLSFVAEGADKQ